MLSGIFRIFHRCVSGNVYLSRVQRCRAGYSDNFSNVSAETFISQEFKISSWIIRIFHQCLGGNVYLSRVQRCRVGYSDNFSNVSAETFISQEFRDVELDIQNISPMSQRKRFSP
jgi:hypothetical protein